MFINSCSKDLGPRESLKNFIDYRFSSSQSFSELEKMTTGQFLDYLRLIEQQSEAGSNEKFLKITSEKKLQKKSLKIVSENCEDKKCFVTYILSFSEGTMAKVEVKSMAELIKVDKKWLISNINDIKTHINSPEM